MTEKFNWKRYIALLLVLTSLVTAFPAYATMADGEEESLNILGADTATEEEEAPKGNSPIYSDNILKYTGANAPDLNAGACIVVEATTGQVVYEKNSTEKMYPASTTKMMTALIAFEHGSLDDKITCSSTAIYHNTLIPDGSTAGLKAGEELTLRDVLYCLLLPSANEAACVLAEYVAGTVENFVVVMNQRAEELGCTNTHFANPHGLTNENHYTTAHDLYCIAYEFAKHEELMEIANTTSYTVPATNMSDERVLNTTNHLISTRTQTRYIYEYARGIKTGFTSAAQHCLVSTAQKNDMYLIAVVMKAPVLADNTITSFTDSKKIYEWVFANYELKKILKKGTAVTEAYVSLSDEKDSPILEPDEDVCILIPKGSFDESLMKITPPENVVKLTAPVAKGEKVAEASVTYEGADCGKINLVTATGAKLSEFMDATTKADTLFKSKLFVFLAIAIPALFVIYIIYITFAAKRRRKKMVYGRRYHR